MKKIFIFLGLMFVMLSSTYAQKGRQAIGFGLSYGTEIESAGLGIKYQYNITNPLRIEPSFNYFFENDNVSMLDLNVNFHYLCPVAQSVKLYPLFGLTMSNWMFDMHDLDVDWDGDHVHVDDGGNHNEFRIGVNLGAGAEFALGRNWARMLNSDTNWLMILTKGLLISELLIGSKNILMCQNENDCS